MLTQELLDAYLATHYQVTHPAGIFTLRIGQQSPELLHLLHTSGQACAAFITAWNPHSQPRSREENDVSQQALRNGLQLLGYVAVLAIGLDPAGEWPGEESVLVLGLQQTDAVSLGRKYAQNAIVWAGADAVPRLFWCY